MRTESLVNGPTPVRISTPSRRSSAIRACPPTPQSSPPATVTTRTATSSPPRSTLDAGRAGHETGIRLDSVFHTYVERETIHIGMQRRSRGQRRLRPRRGVLTVATNLNGHANLPSSTTVLALVGVVKLATRRAADHHLRLPSRHPFRHRYYEYNAAGDLTLVTTADTDIASCVSTRQRELAGTANTFDTVSFVDGAGQHAGNDRGGDGAGEWIARDFMRFSSQGEETRCLPALRPPPTPVTRSRPRARSTSPASTTPPARGPEGKPTRDRRCRRAHHRDPAPCICRWKRCSTTRKALTRRPRVSGPATPSSRTASTDSSRCGRSCG